MADGKRCAKCGETKPLDEFHRNQRWNDGRHPYCKLCKNEADRLSRAKHGDRLRAEGRARYAADPEPAKARRKKRYAVDPARASAEAIAWNRANPDRHAASAKKWQQANLDGKVREYTRARYALRKGASTIKFSPEQLAQRAAYYGGLCWVCRAPFVEWDHVKPLSKGGWHCLSNLRPICRTCNARKRNTWPFVA